MSVMQAMFQPPMDVERIDLDEDAQRFRLKATGGGAFARMIGLGSKATLTVDATGVRMHKSKFGSDETVFVPRSKIASTVCVLSRPMEFLGLGVALLPIFGIGLIFLILFFVLKKRIVVGVLSDGHTLEWVKLKGNFDMLEDIRDGMRILEELLRGQQREPYPLSDLEPIPALPVDEKAITYCKHCGAKMSLPTSSLGRKIRCPACREPFTAEAGLERV